MVEGIGRQAFSSQPPRDTRGSASLRAAAGGFLGMVALDSLAAYAILGIPVPWFAYPFGLGALMVLITHRGAFVPPGSAPMVALIAYGLLVHLALGLLGSGLWEMPSRSTATYGVFLGSRYLTLAGYLLALVVTYNLALTHGVKRVATWYVCWAGIIASLSIYMYLAQLYGFWEPPRTRMGTGGQDFLAQRVQFTYAFHRALGTFREPSHLASWLVAPLLIAAFALRTRMTIWIAGLCITALALSGSVAGLISLVLAATAMALVNPGRFSRTIPTATLILVSVWIVGRVFQADVVSVIQGRGAAALTGGISATNREYIFRYIQSESPPLLGIGLGNANIALSAFFDSGLIQSHSNLFLHMWYALGIPGLLLIGATAFRPLLSPSVLSAARSSATVCVLWGSVFAWLVLFFVQTEEINISFGVLAGLLWASVGMAKVRRL